jgi:hypothetical protein
MTDKQIKQIWKELDKLGCSKHITERILKEIVKRHENIKRRNTA